MDSVTGLGTGEAKAPILRQRLVDWFRLLARDFLRNQPPNVQAAFSMVCDGAEAAMAEVPPSPDLRAWHSLVMDLGRALRKHDADLSERARLLAGRLHQFTERLSRAPEARVALRPTSRRVLEAIVAIGGASCTLAAVRQHTGISQTHMSNIVRILAAYGFIAIQADDQDGRGRRLAVTPHGQAAIGNAQAQRGRQQRFEGHITRTVPKHDQYEALTISRAHRAKVAA